MRCGKDHLFTKHCNNTFKCPSKLGCNKQFFRKQRIVQHILKEHTNEPLSIDSVQALELLPMHAKVWSCTVCKYISTLGVTIFPHETRYHLHDQTELFDQSQEIYVLPLSNNTMDLPTTDVDMNSIPDQVKETAVKDNNVKEETENDVYLFRWVY